MQGSILIVEDSDSLRYLIRRLLEESGYATIEAAGGEEALRRLDEATVGMVLTDMQMSGMGGLEFVRRLRVDPRHRNTPVLVMSAERYYFHHHFGRDLDAQEWIDKPFNVDHFLYLVEKYLGEGPTAAAADESGEHGAYARVSRERGMGVGAVVRGH